MKNKLLATAPTIEGILQSIAKFYGGETKKLKQSGENEYTVHSGVDDRQLTSVIVKFRKGRYRFEMVG